MLQAIRDRAQGWIAWLIVLIIALPFALFGVNSYFEGPNTNIVATVSYPKDAFFPQERKVHVAEYDFWRMNTKMEGGAAALEQVADRYAMYVVAEHLGLVVGEGFVQQRLAQQLSDENGNLDEGQYRQYLLGGSTVGMSFLERQRLEYASGLFKDAITLSSFVTPKELALQSQLENQMRQFAYTQIPVKRFADKINITDDEVKTYYDKNKNKYKTQEKLTIEYLELTLDAFTGKVDEPSEQQIKQAYEKYKAGFPEDRRASHILIPVEGEGEQDDKKAADKARQLYEQIQKGADFADVAKKESQDSLSAQKGGDLGFISVETGVDAKFREKLFSMELNTVSEPVRGGFGYHIIKFTDKKVAAGLKPLGQKRADLVMDLKRGKAKRIFDDTQGRVKRAVHEARTELKSVADRFKLTLKTLGPFERRAPTGIAAKPAVRQSLNSTRILNGRNSRRIEVGDDHVVYIRVKHREQPRQQTLEEVSKIIRENLKNTRARQQTREYGDKLKARMDKGEKLQDIAKSEKLEFKSVAHVKRSGSAENNQIVSQIFKMNKPVENKPVHANLTLFTGDYVLVDLLDVKAGDPEKLSKEEKTAAKQRGEGIVRFVEASSVNSEILESVEKSLNLERIN